MLPITIRRGYRTESPLDNLQDEFNRTLSRWWSDGDRSVTGIYPVDIREDNDHIYVEAELPGFKKEDVEITLENGLLHIVAQRKVEEKKGESHLAERRFTRVARSFTLPNTVDETKVDARLDSGVLHLTLNKREEVKPRKIEVK
ncbi:MAG: Hsp20/alpha crystallin family protein [Phycisphaeraceae bacterium]|nr:Hsp20/alpha crystallin family protein [Phycisphaeraceae bacterium]